jgi:hypothetical protein
MTVTISGPKTVVVDDPPFLLLPEEVIVNKGPGVMTVLKTTGENPAPKLPPPVESTAPVKAAVLASNLAEATPTEDPSAAPALLPAAFPKLVLTKPELPPVVETVPVPKASETPAVPVTVAVPTPPAAPPLLEFPETEPPLNLRR